MKKLTMRQRFFRKNLIAFLPLLFIPIVLMGYSSLYLIQNSYKKNLENDSHVLFEQVIGKADLVTRGFAPLILSADIDGQTSYIAKKLLNSVQLDYTDLYLLNSIKDQLTSIRNTWEYVQSINIYYENENQYYLSDIGKQVITTRDDFWFKSYLQNRKKEKSWTTLTEQSLPGNMKRYIVSLFYILGKGEGVIVFNLHKDELEKKLLNDSITPGHTIAIFNKDNDLILGSYPPHVDDWENLYLTETSIHKGTGWRYVLFSEKKVVFQVYDRIFLLIFLMLGLSLIVGILLSIILTKRRTRQIYEIIDSIKKAENNEALPIIPDGESTTYAYIIKKIVDSFISQSYLKSQLEARKYKEKTAQLIALQAQLNPHFLYNTLETLNWKAYQLYNKPNVINDMINNLSELLRYSLDTKGDTVSLKEELYYIDCYLSIQLYRYKNRFDIVWDNPPECQNALLPRMVLQPIVENAIIHGIGPLSKKGVITLSSRLEKDFLFLTITDDGVGLSEDELESLFIELAKTNFDMNEHIGLRNVNSRLILRYGIPLSIKSLVGKGTSIIMKIPQSGEENDEYLINS
ncbi:sensor histidine kinase [uncultured Sphaerochaeta sp.]|uniref:sensor histidine kinase n=1 Tax=uncultured Sphaerochaeta sp. TaxID=886478 RepID=UPI002A0A650A|nr:sensor histidine kinase [uncultured Sphaerochaeta sp.]